METVPDVGISASVAAASAEDSPRVLYDTPKGWFPSNASGMRRVAFIVQDGSRKAEITVVDLPVQAGALLPNVNRWRGQIKLPEVTQAELDESVSRIPVADAEGNYLELVGPEEAGTRQAILAVAAMREQRAWFFKLWGEAELAFREKPRFQEFVKSVRFAAPGAGNAPTATAESDGGNSPNSPLVFDTPEGWTPTEVSGVRRAAFEVTSGTQKVEITGMQLPGRVEALLPNVNRWRRQVQLGQITQADLEKMVKRLPIAGADADYVELVSPEGAKPRLAMLAVLATCDGQSWLFRMIGDADLTLREKNHFEGFVKSVKISSANTSRHGN
jgi:hypothetical protein